MPELPGGGNDPDSSPCLPLSKLLQTHRIHLQTWMLLFVSDAGGELTKSPDSEYIACEGGGWVGTHLDILNQICLGKTST